MSCIPQVSVLKIVRINSWPGSFVCGMIWNKEILDCIFQHKICVLHIITRLYFARQVCIFLCRLLLNALEEKSNPIYPHKRLLIQYNVVSKSWYRRSRWINYDHILVICQWKNIRLTHKYTNSHINICRYWRSQNLFFERRTLFYNDTVMTRAHNFKQVGSLMIW